MMGDLARLDGYDPNASFPPIGGNDVAAANEAAAARIARGVRRPSEASQETIDKLAGAASDVLIPKTPLDVALTAATLPFGGPLARPAARAGMLALGGLFQPSEAEAGPAGVARRAANKLGEIAGFVRPETGPLADTVGANRIVRYRKGQPEVEEQPFHGFSKLRTGKTPGEMTSIVEGADPVVRPRVSPDWLLGKELIFTPGDRSRAGGVLTHVGETKLTKPVRMEGGADFPFVNPEQAWANAPAHSTQMAKLGQQVLERGNEPVLAYMAMGKGAVDSAKQMALPALDLTRQSGLSKSAAATLDERMRGAKGYPGWGSPRLDEWLAGTSGTNRAKFVKNLDQGWAREGGAPDLGELRYAITDPRLRNTPTGSVGLTLSRFDPTAGVIPSAHSTYPTAVTNVASGTLGGSIPWHLAAPDVHNWLVKRGDPTKFADRPTYYQERKPTAKSFPKTQVVDERWVENVNNWIKENPGMWAAPPAAAMGAVAAQDRYAQ